MNAAHSPSKNFLDTISFSSSDFSEIGVVSADEVTFELRVYNNDDWSVDSYVEEVFTIYPTGKTAGEIVIPERQTGDNEKVIIDNEYYTFVILDFDPEGYWGQEFDCYLENKTDHNMMFSWDNVSINGYMCDPFWADSIAAGKRGYSQISFSESDLQESGIEAIESVSFTLSVYDDDDWDGYSEEISSSYEIS